MAYSIIMPKAGMAMEVGTVIRWLKDVGDPVKAGEPLLEIETDKVAMEVESEVSGYLLKIVHPAGDEVRVTETIGFIGQEGESFEAAEKQASPGPPLPNAAKAAVPTTGADDSNGSTSEIRIREKRTVAATPAARRRAREQGIEISGLAPSGAHGEVKLRDLQNAAQTTGRSVSHLARAVAEKEGLNPTSLEGSGPQGRIVRGDVIQALSDLGGSRAVSRGVETDKSEAHTPLSGMRKVIADRMTESHLAIPPVTINTPADVTALLKLREEINDGNGDLKISINDLVLRATAVALTGARYMLRTIDGSDIVDRSSINVGMAVAAESGLLVPVIRDADKLTLSALSRRAASLAARARQRALSPDDLSGGTFTVTNLGMYGTTSFTPIIYPSQSAILGVNAARGELILQDGRVQERKVMTLSLTIDHRIIDGAQGAVFLQSLVALLERPLKILI